MNTDFFAKAARASFFSLFLVGTVFSASAQSTEKLPTLEEVQKLLRENMAGMTPQELDRATVRGLLNELHPQVALVTNNAPADSASVTGALSRTEVYDRNYGYFRVKEVGSGLAQKFATSFKEIPGTNKMKGIVVDLRYASGNDYGAAAEFVDQFVNSEQPLIDWSTGSAKARKKSDAIALPVAVLINRETRGAAEALAAALREAKVGLLIGSATAGQASIYKDVPLQNGQHLRIASSQIKVGKGTVLEDTLKPDIEVRVNSEDEKQYFEDPYKVVSKPFASVQMTLATNTVATAETNRPRTRLNEAELVRRKREGLSEDEEFIENALTTMDSELKLLRDPSLARAIDLLKGLSVIQPTRPL